MKRKAAFVASKTLAIYGFAAWVYIALCALVHPYTLSWRLTHFLPYPREDTFGALSFVISIVAFFIYQMLRPGDDALP